MLQPHSLQRLESLIKEGQALHVLNLSFLTSAETLPKRTAWPVALENPVIISLGLAFTLVACF